MAMAELAVDVLLAVGDELTESGSAPWRGEPPEDALPDG